MSTRGNGQQRTDAERTAHRKIVADAILTCRHLPDVARELDVSLPTVYADVKKLQAEWQEHAMRDIGEVKADELKKLDRIEKEAWKAWVASGGEMKKRRTGITGKGKVDITEIHTESGDPRYLAVIQSCMKQRAELLGMNKMPLDWKANDGVSINISTREQIAQEEKEITKLEKLLRQRAGIN